MNVMNMAAEEWKRREAMLYAEPGTVVVRVPVVWDGYLCLPCHNGNEEEEAVFKVMTVGDNILLENACRYEHTGDEGQKIVEMDFNEMRRLALRRNLLSWSLDVPIERANGWMTSSAYTRVGKVPAPLLEAFLDGFWRSSEVSADEERMIDKQSTVLFGKNSRGVSNACEAVRLYCTLGQFADKFDISREELNDLPLREYLMLKLMASNENEAMKRNHSSGSQHHSSRISTGRGNPRSSRAQRIPL
jgi:hypothetical protein